MQEQRLKDYLSSKSKEDLKTIIINHYKFLVKKIETLKKEYEDFKNQEMNNLAECVHDEMEFIILQLKWYENYIKKEIEEVG